MTDDAKDNSNTHEPDDAQRWYGHRVETVGTDDDGNHELRVREGGDAYPDYVFVEEVTSADGVEESVLVHRGEVEELYEAIQELMRDE